MFDEDDFWVVVVKLGSFQAQPLNIFSGFFFGAYPSSHVASGSKLSGAGATRIFGGEVIHI